MNTSSDAAESTVRMCMQGIEIAAKITGSGAKNVTVLSYTILKNQKQTKGKTSLTNMLKTNKELKVFSLKEEDLKKFTEEAKGYGVLFCALINRKHKSNDGLVDIMVRAEDASKINRIIERFKLSIVDTASIRSEISKSKEPKENDIEVSIEDKLVNEMLSKPIQKENNEQSNPYLAQTEKDPLSETLSKNKMPLEEGAKKIEKPSVREEIKRIEQEQKEKSKLDDSKETVKVSKNRETKHTQPKNKKKKNKERRI